jgi:hypothetical protein
VEKKRRSRSESSWSTKVLQNQLANWVEDTKLTANSLVAGYHWHGNPCLCVSSPERVTPRSIVDGFSNWKRQLESFKPLMCGETEKALDGCELEGRVHSGTSKRDPRIQYRSVRHGTLRMTRSCARSCNGRVFLPYWVVTYAEDLPAVLYRTVLYCAGWNCSLGWSPKVCSGQATGTAAALACKEGTGVSQNDFSIHIVA